MSEAISFQDKDGDSVSFTPISCCVLVRAGKLGSTQFILLEVPQLVALKQWIENYLVSSGGVPTDPEYIKRYEV